MSLDDRWSAILKELRFRNRYRELAPPCGVDFASNDYLGYANRARMPVQEPTGEFHRSGMASRVLSGHHAVWDEVEAALAVWHGSETALVFSSGYVANEGLLATVIEPQDWVASDELNHASIIDGLRLARAEKFIYRHRDLDHLKAGLAAAAQARVQPRQLFVVTESLFGMDGDRAPLELLVRLAEQYEAHVIVDEAHSTGCFGPAGAGCIRAAGLRKRVLATVHTGGKALAVPGAYVCGSALLRELLVNRCRHFMFTTALPAAVGPWWLSAIHRVQCDQVGRTALHDAAAVFRAELARRGVTTLGHDYIVPVLLGDEARALDAARKLRETGLDIRAVRPPSVPSETARLRVSIHADHPHATLLAAAAAVAEVAV